MSNITGDGESFSSENNTGGDEVQQHHDRPFQVLPTTSNGEPSPVVKKKRNLPGTPDPSAEVIALSPTALMATNRFVCEICNKGFQRDQNLQLHRRGHNLPWKLRQRTSTEEVRKRVYICPETSCVHHNPSRALGDLTGIKKHFCRKHGEKKWKCDKCSKKYAVQSDLKAHSKTCGTREYKCDCGTTFSRRDSFITHRAFCDALAQENNNANHHHHSAASTNPNFPEIMIPISGPGSATSISDFKPHNILDLKNPLTMAGPTSAGLLASAHMSATALLQKAAQMGATASGSSVITGTMAGTDTRQYTTGYGGDGGMGMVNRFFDGSVGNIIDGGMYGMEMDGRSGTGGNLGLGRRFGSRGEDTTMTVDFLGVGGARPTAVVMQQEGGMDEFEGMGGSRLLGFHQFQQQMSRGQDGMEKTMWRDV